MRAFPGHTEAPAEAGLVRKSKPFYDTRDVPDIRSTVAGGIVFGVREKETWPGQKGKGETKNVFSSTARLDELDLDKNKLQAKGLEHLAQKLAQKPRLLSRQMLRPPPIC